MARHREEQPSLFDKEPAKVVLDAAQKNALAKVLEVLLGEIAAALAGKKGGESSHE